VVGITNEEAILRLAQDKNDAEALMAVAENSSDALNAAVERHFAGRERRKKALLTLLVYISWHAKEFVPEQQDACQWVAEFANTWCRTIAQIADDAKNSFAGENLWCSSSLGTVATESVND
jgi:hypothetical protein